MRRFVFVLAAVAAIVSCKKPLMDTMPRWYSRGPRSYMSSPPEKEGSPVYDTPVEKGVYIAAICFPDWAKWKDGDFRGAEIVLFRDSTKVAKAPAGPRPDPERIRILDGHLWTDSSSGGVTDLYCDGIHVLTIPDEEMIKGILLENGRIHTLGQRRGGTGLCYRVNAESVFSTGAGTVISSFARDTSGIYFVYGIPIRMGESAKMEYHIMKGADDVKTIYPTENGAIYDIRVKDGTIFRSERRSEGHTSLCLVIGDVYHSVGVENRETVHLCKLVDIDGEMMIKGYSTYKNATWHWIRSKDGTRHQVAVYGVPDFYVSEGSVAYVINNTDGFVETISVGGAKYELAEKGYRLSSSDCADFKNGVFAAAITDTSGRKHRLFLDGRITPLEFNGYFTSLKIIE